jgi:hypothetical protein
MRAPSAEPFICFLWRNRAKKKGELSLSQGVWGLGNLHQVELFELELDEPLELELLLELLLEFEELFEELLDELFDDEFDELLLEEFEELLELELLELLELELFELLVRVRNWRVRTCATSIISASPVWAVCAGADCVTKANGVGAAAAGPAAAKTSAAAPMVSVFLYRMDYSFCEMRQRRNSASVKGTNRQTRLFPRRTRFVRKPICCEKARVRALQISISALGNSSGLCGPGGKCWASRAPLSAIASAKAPASSPLRSLSSIRSTISAQAVSPTLL